MNKQDIINELRNSLPSIRIVEVTNNLAVLNPYTGKLIYLKQRPNFEDTPLSEYVSYNEKHDKLHNYQELLTKSVIIDFNLLNERGKELLKKINSLK
jgi:predicted ATP-binding protein involved in virulence